MTKTKAAAALIEKVEAMEAKNRELGISFYSWKMYTTCKNVFYVLKKDVETPDPRWADRDNRSESIVLDLSAYSAMVAIADGGEKEVIKLMIKAMMNVTGKTWKEVRDIVEDLVPAIA